MGRHCVIAPETIKELPMKIKIITSDWCTYCEAAKKLLRDNGLDYTEIDLGYCFDLMTEHDLRTVPQIFVNEKLLEGGYTGLKESIDLLKKGDDDE